MQYQHVGNKDNHRDHHLKSVQSAPLKRRALCHTSATCQLVPHFTVRSDPLHPAANDVVDGSMTCTNSAKPCTTDRAGTTKLHSKRVPPLPTEGANGAKTGKPPAPCRGAKQRSPHADHKQTNNERPNTVCVRDQHEAPTPDTALHEQTQGQRACEACAVEMPHIMHSINIFHPPDSHHTCTNTVAGTCQLGGA